MNKIYVLFIWIVAVLLMFCACSHGSMNDTHAIETELPVYTDPATEPTIIFEEPTVCVNTEPTDPPEPTVPSLGIAAGSYVKCYNSDNYNDYLNYYVHVPADAVPDMPLVVYLHGDGEVNLIQSLPERGISKFAKEIYGDAFPFILLEPNTRIDSWTRGDIPELLFELINDVASSYDINEDKIIITGHSRGAIGVWDMISIYGGFFSAAVPVSSPHQKGHIDLLKASEVPVWTFAGNIGETERWYHQYLRQNVDIINGCDGYGKFTVLYGCDHGMAKIAAYVKETFDWMLAQERGVIPEE